jgi:hypothetical protein
MYGELWLLEDEITNARNAGRDTAEMVARFDRLETHVNRLRMPLAYASTLYTLRDHVEQVRESLKKHPDKGGEVVVPSQ